MVGVGEGVNKISGHLAAIVGQPSGQPEVPLFRPLGGIAAVGGSTEVRYDWAYGIKLATFDDAGFIAPNFRTIRLDQQFRWSTGVGLRYNTLIGPVRFDLGGIAE